MTTINETSKSTPAQSLPILINMRLLTSSGKFPPMRIQEK